jgi:hypothetical protein
MSVLQGQRTPINQSYTMPDQFESPGLLDTIKQFTKQYAPGLLPPDTEEEIMQRAKEKQVPTKNFQTYDYDSQKSQSNDPDNTIEVQNALLDRMAYHESKYGVKRRQDNINNVPHGLAYGAFQWQPNRLLENTHDAYRKYTQTKNGKVVYKKDTPSWMKTYLNTMRPELKAYNYIGRNKSKGDRKYVNANKTPSAYKKLQRKALDPLTYEQQRDLARISMAKNPSFSLTDPTDMNAIANLWMKNWNKSKPGSAQYSTNLAKFLNSQKNFVGRK